MSDIDALVREEKRLTAVECHTEAWAEGISAGIEPEIIAEAALSTAFAELLRKSGETAALALLDRMREQVDGGCICAEPPAPLDCPSVALRDGMRTARTAPPGDIDDMASLTPKAGRKTAVAVGTIGRLCAALLLATAAGILPCRRRRR